MAIIGRPKTQVFALMADTAAPRAWPDLPLTPAQWGDAGPKRQMASISAASRPGAGIWRLAAFSPSSPICRARMAPRIGVFRCWTFCPTCPLGPAASVSETTNYFRKFPPACWSRHSRSGFGRWRKDGTHADEAAEAIDTAFRQFRHPHESAIRTFTGRQSQFVGAVNVAAVSRRVGAVGLFMILLLVRSWHQPVRCASACPNSPCSRRSAFPIGCDGTGNRRSTGPLPGWRGAGSGVGRFLRRHIAQAAAGSGPARALSFFLGAG